MTNARAIRVRARWLGVKDGFKQGRTFTSGMTWTDGPWLDAGANDAYDSGVNIGQRLRTGRVHHA